ncbi:hypothetical protein ACFLSF_00230 [Candidatus Bipolaricaulota bacterium]
MPNSPLLTSGSPSLHTQFHRDIRAAFERLERGGSLIAETACGPIEYATLGEGAPVLLIHGIS